ncbi:cyclic nucleotide-binding domain-containing protein [Novosphingobium sp. MMS21-SN21R]|uniref:cyclic nucleotide-binding domain-containing protein n=1 Tax=Novosphingobium sp. MMS21-SN21R TaxID=2969298 RepID=UPI00288470D6|nr:cyclic nucleotide-binding domain-containing protein [Novosphingobium sp. MMS21-SN21R]MDT0509138.1 cyclic nucleotide-binding domain-containing protein [Novosphingobium sp. MMS21-SN21R]
MGDVWRNAPQLAGFDTDEWNALSAHAAAFAVAEGETLFRQGDAPGALYLVERGVLEIATRLPGDEAAVMSTIRPGEMVGEFALLDDGPRSAHVRALEDTSGIAVSRGRFLALLADGTPWALRLGMALRRLVASRTRATLGRVVAEGMFDPGALRQLHAGPKPVAAKGDVAVLLRGLSRLAGAAEVSAQGHLHTIAAGGTVAEPGEAQDGLHLVLRGAVRAGVIRGAMQEQVFVFGPGCFVGLTGHSDGRGQPLLVTAAEDSLLLHLPKAALAWLERDAPPWLPALHAAMGRQLVQDQRKANRHLGRSLALTRFNHAGETA